MGKLDIVLTQRARSRTSFAINSLQALSLGLTIKQMEEGLSAKHDNRSKSSTLTSFAKRKTEQLQFSSVALA